MKNKTEANVAASSGKQLATLEEPDMKEIEVQLLTNSAVLPQRAHKDDAGMDLFSSESISLSPGETKVVKTGIAMSIPKGHVGMIADRSSMGKKGIKVAGGIVDSGYRGEIGVILINLSCEQQDFAVGSKIAQMLIIPISTPKPVFVGVFSEEKTDRGEGGFGSTGK